jgi:putative ABC transport system permease protein
MFIFVITLGESRLLKAFLFGVGPSDPKTMVFVAAGLSTVALIACYLPARRTTMVDPLIALKSE